jgi:hypothetical protein
VDLVESWQRGNQPVFVFSSLLAQRQSTVTRGDTAFEVLPLHPASAHPSFGHRSLPQTTRPDLSTVDCLVI